MADSQIQSDDKIKKLQGQVQDVTDVMEKNIELGNNLNKRHVHHNRVFFRQQFHLRQFGYFS